MKLDEKTLEILDNFSKISSSILIFDGNIQKTMTPSKSVLAEAELPFKFEKEFGIYDLPKFLALLSLFDDPNIELDSTEAIISEGDTKATYMFCDKELIKHPPKDKSISMSNPEVSFQLSKDTFSHLKKSAAVLGVPHFVVSGDGEKISITVKDMNVTSKDKLSKTVGETSLEFEYIFDIDVMKFLDHNYDVTIANPGTVVVCFSSKDTKLKYWVPSQSSK